MHPADPLAIQSLWVDSPQLAAKKRISFPKSVIPACFKRESRRVRNWTPDKNIPGVTPLGNFASRLSDTPLLVVGVFQLLILNH